MGRRQPFHERTGAVNLRSAHLGGQRTAEVITVTYPAYPTYPPECNLQKHTPRIRMRIGHWPLRKFIDEALHVKSLTGYGNQTLTLCYLNT